MKQVAWLVTWLPLLRTVGNYQEGLFSSVLIFTQRRKKNGGPNENKCFSGYQATADRHMLYIALSIANWCSVMTTTCIWALKVYLTWCLASKFKDVFARFTWRAPFVSQRVTRENAFSSSEPGSRQVIGFTGCYTQMSLICANTATSTVLLLFDVTKIVKEISAATGPTLSEIIAIFPASSIHSQTSFTVSFRHSSDVSSGQSLRA